MKLYGCNNRPPFGQVYFTTGGRVPIRHVMTTDCQYRKTELGKTDPKCNDCKHKTNEPT